MQKLIGTSKPVRQSRYSISNMSPHDIHIGGVPAVVRAAVLEEQELAFKRSDAMRSQLRTAARGM